MSNPPNGQNGKDLFDVITIILAAYGAILATVIGLKDLAKERKSLKIILEAVHWTERHQILITNNSHRPITITTININIIPKNRRGGYTSMPSGVFWATEPQYEPPTLPLTLQDGDTVIFHLSEYITGELSDKNNHLSIIVYDGEGHAYSKYIEGEYDPRYQYHTLDSVENNIIRRIWLRTTYKIRKLFTPKS